MQPPRLPIGSEFYHDLWMPRCEPCPVSSDSRRFLVALPKAANESPGGPDAGPGIVVANGIYTEAAAFSNCFNLFASNSCSRRFFVIAMARWISSRASESLPIFISRSPRTLGKR
jgi:hypothetical protein